MHVLALFKRIDLKEIELSENVPGAGGGGVLKARF
jgi:hypothetical protein